MRASTHLFRLLKEFLLFARDHKAWWIVPIAVALLLLTALVAISAGIVPFIYPVS